MHLLRRSRFVCSDSNEARLLWTSLNQQMYGMTVFVGDGLIFLLVIAVHASRKSAVIVITTQITPHCLFGVD